MLLLASYTLHILTFVRKLQPDMTSLSNAKGCPGCLEATEERRVLWKKVRWGARKLANLRGEFSWAPTAVDERRLSQT